MQEEEIYKRDVWEPTLDDHFDKETMPKPMQVRDLVSFGLLSLRMPCCGAESRFLDRPACVLAVLAR